MIEWPRTVEEARRTQELLSGRVKLKSLERPIETIAGIDAAFSKEETFVAVAVFEFETLTPIDEYYCIEKTAFPYIPGYLSFREGPSIICAIEKIGYLPDLLILDGQGIAHPRRLGIASHIGVILNRPSIGCAKSRLVGQYREPSPERGASGKLTFRGEEVGAVLRTRKDVKPLFVSPGHLITVREAVDIILYCTRRYRLPEPIRMADRLTKDLKRDHPFPSP
jgi:deoxyribonuclease V